MIKIYEADVMKVVTDVLNVYNLLYTRNTIGGVTIKGQYVHFGTAGWSDIIGMTHDGKFLAVEVKRPGGNLSEKQKAFLDRVNAENGIGIVVDSVESLLNQLKGRNVI